MSGRGPRSFRYGARLAVTAPLALVFLVVAAEMVMLAIGASLYWRIAFVTLGALAILLALSMVREILVRLRGKRQIVVTARELTVPSTDRGSPAVTIPYRDIRKLELSAGPGFKRVLKIGHVGGELEISGVMLGSVGELDEIHGLIKAARNSPRRASRSTYRRARSWSRDSASTSGTFVWLPREIAVAVHHPESGVRDQCLDPRGGA